MEPKFSVAFVLAVFADYTTCSYPFKRVLIKFIGIHKGYDNINAETV